jgi:hypothetical protein
MKFKIASAVVAMFFLLHTQAQDSTKSTIKTIIDAKHYVFEPVSTITGGGRSRQLTPGYYLEIYGDTAKIYLPYYGKAYSAPMNPSDVGYDFTSTKMEYAIKEGKKNSYVISVKVKDKINNPEFNLTVYDDGTAYLRAMSTDRQSTSYNGSVRMKE